MKEKLSNNTLALMEVRQFKKRTSKVNYDFYEKDRGNVFFTKNTKKIETPPIRSIMKKMAN